MKTVALTFVFAITFSSHGKADVFLNRTEAVATHTDDLLNVLSSSMVPGGDRDVVLNGNRFSVRRLVRPHGDGSVFHKFWTRVSEVNADGITSAEAIIEKLSFDEIDAYIEQRVPLRPIEQNFTSLAETTLETVGEHVAIIKDTLSDDIESAFAYETPQWRAVARIPVRALVSDSPFAKVAVEDGYILLAEKLADSTQSTAFWFMRFGEDFNLLDIFRDYKADAPGEAAYVPRYPQSKRVMTFEESANGWHSRTWSYESNSGIESHVRHYRDEHSKAGFRQMNNPVVGASYAILQFRNPASESTVFIDRTGTDTIATLQLRNMYAQ